MDTDEENGGEYCCFPEEGHSCCGNCSHEDGCVPCLDTFFHFDYFDIDSVSKSSCLSSQSLLLFRLTMFLWMIVSFAFSWESVFDKGKFLAYLTNITWAVVIVYLVCASTASYLEVQGTFPKGKLSEHCFARFTFVLFVIAAALEGAVVILYWVLVYPGVNTIGDDAQNWQARLTGHGFAWLVTIVELFLNRIEFPIRMFLFCLIYAVVYMVINGLFYVGSNGVLLYNALDWGNTGKAIVVIIEAIILVIMSYSFNIALVRCRKRFIPQERGDMVRVFGEPVNSTL